MKKTLLLADDSPTIQKVINLTFADEGIDVIAVSDGNAAIQQLRDMTPDLVMADVHMPGLNGYQICERLRQNAELKNVPVILLVGSFEPFDEEEAKRVGADDFLMKPFQSIRQLVSRVTALLEAEKQEVAQPEAVEAPAEETVASVEETADAFSGVAETPDTEIPETGLATQEIADAPVAHEDDQAGEVQETIPPEYSSLELAAKTEETEVAETAGIAEEEDDELAAFESEFDKKFPDAAALSSENIGSIGFAGEFASSLGVPAEEHTTEESPAESIAEITYEEPEALRVGEFSQPEPVVESEEAVSEIPPLPENDLNRIIAMQYPERPAETSETGEPEEKAIELVTPETGETSSILDLRGFGGFEAQQSENVLLDLESEEKPLEEREAQATEQYAREEYAAERYTTPITEAVNVIVAERTIEEELAETPTEVPTETPRYDFRNPDAFDEDSDIQETFHGLAKIAEVPEPVFQAPAVEAAVEPAAEVAAAPSLERIVDDEDPGDMSVDQADGFSGKPQLQVSQEAIDAAAQRVFEQISEKVVADLARGLMPGIKDMIAREIKKEHE